MPWLRDARATFAYRMYNNTSYNIERWLMYVLFIRLESVMPVLARTLSD